MSVVDTVHTEITAKKVGRTASHKVRTANVQTTEEIRAIEKLNAITAISTGDIERVLNPPAIVTVIDIEVSAQVQNSAAMKHAINLPRAVTIITSRKAVMI